MKKGLRIIGVIVTVSVVGYVAWYFYNDVARSIAEDKIREAGLNPDDYDLTGVAPWNVREHVTDIEIEKAGLNPDDYDIEGTPTAEEVRVEVVKQEIAKQLASYDLTLDDIDLSDVDLLTLSPSEIEAVVYQKVREKMSP